MSNNRRAVEAEGFWLGTQGVSVAASLGKFTAVFAQQCEKATARFASRVKKLEAKANVLYERRQKAAARWAQFEAATGGQESQMVLPLLAVVVAFLLWLGETYLLAPVLDGMGVTDPLEQKFVASVVVLAAATLLEVAAQLYRTPDSSFVLRVICFLLSGATLLFLGWWRGAELIYAAAQGSGALQDFLSQTEGLTTIVITLLTIILPVGATLALDWGLSQARFGWGWRKARRANRHFSAKHERVARALETVRIECEQERAVWAQRREECASTFLQAYELGRATGARQLPFRQFAQKIFAVGALVMAGVLSAAYLFVDGWLAQSIFSDAARLAIYLLTTIGATGIYAASAVKAWHRPNAMQLYEQRRPIWRGEAQHERLIQAGVTPAMSERASDRENVDEVIFDEDETTQVAARAA
jgi:hypothetical protein